MRSSFVAVATPVLASLLAAVLWGMVLRKLPRRSVVPMVWAAVSGTTAGTADERGRRPNWASTGVSGQSRRLHNDMLEFGHVLAKPGDEQSWFEDLPSDLRDHMVALDHSAGA